LLGHGRPGLQLGDLCHRPFRPWNGDTPTAAAYSGVTGLTGLASSTNRGATAFTRTGHQHVVHASSRPFVSGIVA
jgi:hypothetical protein